METVLIIPVIANELSDEDRKEAERLVKQRDKLFDLGYMIKETRLIEYQGVVMAHYVMHKEI